MGALGAALAEAPRVAGVVDDATLTATNLHAVATALVAAASARTESRGCHRRADYPATSPAWERRIAIRLTEGGLELTSAPLDHRRKDRSMNALSTEIDLAPLDRDVVDAWAAVDPAEVRRIIAVAVDEDLRLGPDVTTEATVPAGAVGVAEVVAREAGVVAGVPVAVEVLRTVASRLGVEASVAIATGIPRVKYSRFRSCLICSRSKNSFMVF